MLSFTELVAVCATLVAVTLMVCAIAVLRYALRTGYKTSDLTDGLAMARNYAHRLVTGEWADE